VPVRQWVLSFPIPLRSLFAAHPELLPPVISNVEHPFSENLNVAFGSKADIVCRIDSAPLHVINPLRLGGEAFQRALPGSLVTGHRSPG